LDKAVLGTNKQLIGVIHQARRVALDYSSGRTTICAWLARESIGPADKLDADQQPAMTFGDFQSRLEDRQRVADAR